MEQNKGALTDNQLPDGYFCASEEEREYGVLTMVLPDGSTVKQVVLPKCKKVAVVKKATKKDFYSVGKLTRDVNKQLLVLIAGVVELDGRAPLIDEVERLHIKDFLTLVYAMDKLGYK